MLVAIAAALASAALSALAVAILHRSAGMVQERAAHEGVGHFLLGNAVHPLWLLGMSAATLAAVLHAVALHGGPLTLVQPLMVTGVVFALAFRQLIEGRRPAPSQLAWAAALAVGLVAFLLAATPGEGPPQPPDTLPTLVAVVAITIGMGVCGYLGRRAEGKNAAAFLGSGAGLAFAGSAGLLKQVTNEVGHGLGAVFGTWPVYALAFAGVAGVVLNQIAFRAAPLRASLPALSTIDPLASLVIGVAVFDEPFRLAPAAVVAEVISLVLVMVSVAALTGGEPWAARKQASYGYRRRKQKDPERVERGCYQPRQANGMLLAAETVFVDGSCDPGAVWARSPPRGEHG